MSTPTLCPSELILSDNADSYSYNANILPFPPSEYLFEHPPHRPLFLVEVDELVPLELGPTSQECVYFLNHPAVEALLPFLRFPARIKRTDPRYLVALLNAALPAFVSEIISLYFS